LDKGVDEFLKKICRKLCEKLFEHSVDRCVAANRDQVQGKADSTLRRIRLHQRVQDYCQRHKDRFWLLYYPLAQKAIRFQCRKGGDLEERCVEYVSDRILKHLRNFDASQKTEIFEEVRAVLIEGREVSKHRELVCHYVKKIQKDYRNKKIKAEQLKILLDSDIGECRERKDEVLQSALCYGALLSAEETVRLIAKGSPRCEEALRSAVYNELLTMEQFASYIKKTVYSRAVDFFRSKESEWIASDTLDEKADEWDEEALLSEETPHLAILKPEYRLINKLRYGFALDASEFIQVFYSLDYHPEGYGEFFDAEERFYLRLRSVYGLSDDEIEIRSMDVDSIRQSLEEKITRLRENPPVESYIDKEGEIKREIFLKLLYQEPMSSKEIGVILGFTSRQIDKKIENSKKQLKKKNDENGSTLS
jgi:DNA-directed RNA polymerase specialized sigma24 family protein